MLLLALPHPDFVESLPIRDDAGQDYVRTGSLAIDVRTIDPHTAGRLRGEEPQSGGR